MRHSLFSNGLLETRFHSSREFGPPEHSPRPSVFWDASPGRRDDRTGPEKRMAL